MTYKELRRTMTYKELRRTMWIGTAMFFGSLWGGAILIRVLPSWLMFPALISSLAVLIVGGVMAIIGFVESLCSK